MPLPLVVKVGFWLGWIPMVLVLLAGVVAALVSLRRRKAPGALLAVGFGGALLVSVVHTLVLQMLLSRMVPVVADQALGLVARLVMDLFLAVAIAGAIVGRGRPAAEVGR